ncbi:MAG TPA: cbb3-type cytochrome c oxidase N-terminal domain-containing protein [Ohtaekwangia sp.]|nr:cbb3-type cytochrome c oxidase N-terminal domain-containing protein [Ohtaekwangia sp.]
MKKFLLLSLMMAGGSSLMAQATESQTFWQDPFSHPMTPIYGLIVLICVVILLIGFVAVAMIRVLNVFSENLAKERAEKLGIPYVPQPTYWQRLVRSLNASVPVEEERSIELEHSYDGIRELDNHLPPWWKYLFYFTIVWSVVYLIAYHVTDSLPLQIDEYNNQVAKAEEVKKQFLATQPKVEIDESTLTYVKDDAIIAKGKEIYTAYCVSCHKADGGGMIGPNLTDEYWLHGGDVKSVYAVVKNGVPEKGMVSWANVLSPEQLRNVSFFVMSLQGSNPPGAKAPQGTIYKAESPVTTSDSTGVQAKL